MDLFKAPLQRAMRMRSRPGSRLSRRWAFHRWSCEWCERTVRTGRCSRDSHTHGSSSGAPRKSPRFALRDRSIHCRNTQSSRTRIPVFATGCAVRSQN